MRGTPATRISIVAIAGLASLVLLIQGCGGGGAASTGGNEAKPGGTLNIGIPADPDSLTPANTLTGLVESTQINETLFRQEESGKMVPLLAEDMSVSPDALTYTITLKQGIKFSDGTPMTSKDVVFSLEAARKSLYYSNLYESITKVSAPSEFKVKITTKEPVPAMEAILAAWVAAIVPDHYGGVTEKVFSEHPIGTGPFKFKSWHRGEALTLVGNSGYWQNGQPLLNEVVFRVIPNDLSRVSQLQGGDIDADFRPPFAQIPSLEQAGFKRKASMGISADILLNENIPLFKDPRVREAIDLAVDRNGINQTALRGVGQIAGSFLTPVVPYFDAGIKAPPQDLAKAKSLIAEAVKEGADPKFTLISWAGETYSTIASQVIQQDLSEIGLTVNLEPIDETSALGQVENGEFEASMTEYYSAVNDPSELTGYVLSYLGKPAGVDLTSLNDLAAKAAAETDPARREALYSELQAAVAKERFLIPLTYAPEGVMLASGIEGLEQTPLTNYYLGKAGWSS